MLTGLPAASTLDYSNPAHRFLMFESNPGTFLLFELLFFRSFYLVKIFKNYLYLTIVPSQSVLNLLQLMNSILIQLYKFPDLNECIDYKHIDFVSQLASQYT